MKQRTEEEARGIEERRARKRDAAKSREAAIARAVANVLDGSCDSCEDAARGQGVPVQLVRVAVRKARAQKGGA